MAAPKRPFGVSLLSVLVVVAGIINIGWGVFFILDRNAVDLVAQTGLTPSQLLWTGIAWLIFGAMQIFLGTQLGKGNEFVRIFYGVLASINLGVGIWGAIALRGEQQVTSVVAAVVAGVVLWILFNSRTDEYFEKVN